MLTLCPGYCVKYKSLGYDLPKEVRSGRKQSLSLKRLQKQDDTSSFQQPSGWDVSLFLLAHVLTCIFLLTLFCFLAQGEIEAIVVPVCLAFLLTTLLGVLFCFNKRDL